jgi:hypothetical protein
MPASIPCIQKRVAQALRNLRTRPVCAIELGAQVFEKLRTVGLHGGANLIERRHRQATGVRIALDHDRWNRADEHDLRNAARPVTANISGHLAAAG